MTCVSCYYMSCFCLLHFVRLVIVACITLWYCGSMDPWYTLLMFCNYCRPSRCSGRFSESITVPCYITLAYFQCVVIVFITVIGDAFLLSAMAHTVWCVFTMISHCVLTHTVHFCDENYKHKWKPSANIQRYNTHTYCAHVLSYLHHGRGFNQSSLTIPSNLG